MKSLCVFILILLQTTFIFAQRNFQQPPAYSPQLTAELKQLQEAALKSDYAWDQHAGRGAGTQGELTFAHRMGIPVYLICGMPVEQISGWLLGCATEVFCSFDEFQEFAAKLSSEVGADVETQHAASLRVDFGRSHLKRGAGR